MIHAEYKGSNIAENVHNPRQQVVQFFSAIITTFVTRMNHQRKYVTVYNIIGNLQLITGHLSPSTVCPFKLRCSYRSTQVDCSHYTLSKLAQSTSHFNRAVITVFKWFRLIHKLFRTGLFRFLFCQFLQSFKLQ